MTSTLQDIIASRPFTEFHVHVPQWYGDQAIFWPAEVRQQLDDAERSFRSREAAIAVTATIHACVYDGSEWWCIRGLSFTRFTDIDSVVSASPSGRAGQAAGGPVVPPKPREQDDRAADLLRLGRAM